MLLPNLGLALAGVGSIGLILASGSSLFRLLMSLDDGVYKLWRLSPMDASISITQCQNATRTVVKLSTKRKSNPSTV